MRAGNGNTVRKQGRSLCRPAQIELCHLPDYVDPAGGAEFRVEAFDLRPDRFPRQGRFGRNGRRILSFQKADQSARFRRAELVRLHEIFKLEGTRAQHRLEEQHHGGAFEIGREPILHDPDQGRLGPVDDTRERARRILFGAVEHPLKHLRGFRIA